MIPTVIDINIPMTNVLTVFLIFIAIHSLISLIALVTFVVLNNLVTINLILPLCLFVVNLYLGIFCLWTYFLDTAQT
jgi:hypothetical protein